MYFDHIEEREENGSFYIVAIDTKSGNTYLINNHAIIQTSTSSLEGFRLVISVHPDTYVYRGNFQSKEEMEKLSKEIGKLIISADFKTNSIFHT
ncbi:hypothetical protein Q7O56_26085 [Pseudomonas protegens]|uniref:hypothetical protein n=1 Tax=Pseudomonas protegens TaxID=380021 RepID=UPI0027668E3F|nr:hypothetical protein [Pseudomonas protegens]MDP9512503.1 hypothetical protein [Pseudomonas protegens]